MRDIEHKRQYDRERMRRRYWADAHDGDAMLHLWGYTVDHYPVRKHDADR